MKYNTQHIIQQIESGENLKYLFFWGHRKTKNISKSCLSQWYEAPFTLNETNYLTAEHWMMAQKAALFNDFDTHDKIIACKSPGEAKDLGRKVIDFDKQDWIAYRLNIVVSGNFRKFNQNLELKEFLIKTQKRVLVEASPVDNIWGIGLAQDNPNIYNPHKWKGQNLLGFALMEVRDLLLSLNSTSLDKVILPPWLQYPGIHKYSIGWRMGYGEDYIINFASYYQKLSTEEKQSYQNIFPATGDWKDWYN